MKRKAECVIDDQTLFITRLRLSIDVFETVVSVFRINRVLKFRLVIVVSVKKIEVRSWLKTFD